MNRLAAASVIVLTMLGLAACASSPTQVAQGMAQKALSSGEGFCDPSNAGDAQTDIEFTATSITDDGTTALVSFTSTSPSMGDLQGTVTVSLEESCVESVSASLG